MLKRTVLLSLLFYSLVSSGQLVANLELPENSITQKPQLWNMVLTSTKTLNLHIELLLTDRQSGQPLFSATTKPFVIQTGITRLDATQLQPIQYQSLSSQYPFDANPAGLLPVGRFEACYIFHEHLTDFERTLLEQCGNVTVEPLSPPQLSFPDNGDTLTGNAPTFSWLPPAPLSLFSNPSYVFRLVEINPGQTASDAMEKNLPVVVQSNLPGTSFPYPRTAPALDTSKQYAWQVTAKSNGQEVSESETWTFHMPVIHKEPDGAFAIPFVKLRKGEESFAIFVNTIKFDYLNEAGDTSWQVACYDLSGTKRSDVAFSLDNVTLQSGQNLVQYEGWQNADFLDKHLYVLELTNTRNEVYRLHFEFRKTK